MKSLFALLMLLSVALLSPGPVLAGTVPGEAASACDMPMPQALETCEPASLASEANCSSAANCAAPFATSAFMEPETATWFPVDLLLPHYPSDVRDLASAFHPVDSPPPRS